MNNKNNYKLIILLIMFVCLPMVSTDIFIAILPEMVKYYHSNIQSISLCLSGYMVGFSLSVLLAGVLSDKFGRKVILTYGIIIYIITSIAIACSPNLYLFIFLRFMQGVGGGTGTIVVRLIVKDIYKLKQQIKIMTLLSTGMAMSPALAPLIGQQLNFYFNWQSCFWFSAIVAGGMLYLLKFHYHETNLLLDKNIKFTKLFSKFIDALKNKPFLGYLLLICFSWSIYFTFIGLSSFLFQEKFHLTQIYYSYVIVILSVGYCLGSEVARILSKKYLVIKQIVTLGIVICTLSGTLYCYGNFINNLIILIIAMFMMRLGIGLIMPASQVGALNSHHEYTGWYMGCLFFIEFIVCSFLLYFASLIDSIFSNGLGIVVIMILSIMIMLVSSYLINFDNIKSIS